MEDKKSSKRDRKTSAAEFGPEDGMDPKDFFKKSGGRKTGRKSMQLCSQVQDALYWVLGSECGHEDLALMQVLRVQPAPDSTRLLITLAIPNDMAFERAYQLLDEAKGAIRSEVASEINRKKAPDLTFQVIHLPTG